MWAHVRRAQLFANMMPVFITGQNFQDRQKIFGLQ
jgi:hypothetical protein